MSDEDVRQIVEDVVSSALDGYEWATPELKQSVSVEVYVNLIATGSLTHEANDETYAAPAVDPDEEYSWSALKEEHNLSLHTADDLLKVGCSCGWSTSWRDSPLWALKRRGKAHIKRQKKLVKAFAKW